MAQVTGSNSVNVFLGIGLPWLLASFYWYMQAGGYPKGFRVEGLGLRVRGLRGLGV